jgi:signal transduction histidine kinase
LSGFDGTKEVAQSFRLKGDICALVPRRGLLVLQDSSSAVLMELPSVDPALAVGQHLVITGKQCALTRTRFGVRVSGLPIIDNDGLHSKQEKSGTISLPAGMQPMRLEWFNGPAEFFLELEYEGPSVARCELPASAFWTTSDGSQLKQGLAYSVYEGYGWHSLPDFSAIEPITNGVAANLRTDYRTRDQYCAVAFNGFIQIKEAGLYTFHLTSDDGSRLYIGKPDIHYEIVPRSGKAHFAPEKFQLNSVEWGRPRWVQAEGEVAFVGRDQRNLEIEMDVSGRRLPVTIVDGTGLFSSDLLRHWVQVTGTCEFSGDAKDGRLVGIFVPDATHVQIHDLAKGVKNGSVDELTTAAQVRRLKPDMASQRIPSRVRGVVIYATPAAAVLQDASGGVFVNCSSNLWANQPGVGELWEMEGVTDPGYFSPVIVANRGTFLGYTSMPEPIQPTQDQLMNGNLDAEYGELHGIITSVSSSQIDLSMPDGKVTVIGTADRPLPKLPDLGPGGGTLVGSVVRIRGCFATLVDLQSRQVIPGKIFIYPAVVEMEDPSPSNPFQLSTGKLSDFLWFQAPASALQRTKLAGQVLYALPGECFVADGGAGFRVRANDLPNLRVGDLVEAVGFPKLGGPSPVLQQANIRTVGHAELPPPVQLTSDGLLNRNRDSTLVRVEATLISDSVRRDERVLELQSGASSFVARLKCDPRTTKLLPAGCLLQLTGVYAAANEDVGRAGKSNVPFELLLNESSIVVLQKPPWWTVGRALAVVGVLAGGLTLTFVWVGLLQRKVELRTAQLKREIEERQLAEQHRAVEQERTRVAQDLHDELGAGLTEVSMLGALADTPVISTEAKKEYLQQLTSVARSLVASLDEIVWAVNPRNDSIASLVSYFSLYAEPFLQLAGIACRFRVADKIPESQLDPQHRHGMFCAFKEALNNAVRHSKATEVQIAFDAIGDEFVLSVIDNGRGFDLVSAAPGQDGLIGIQQRMQRLGGRGVITSRPGHGTTVEIHLPLNKSQYGQNRNC